MSAKNGRLWLQMDVAMGRHRKTKRLARLLGTSLPQTIGHLFFLIAAVADQGDGPAAETGSLPGWDAEDIAAAAEWDGDAAAFMAALKDAGWLEEKDGCLRIHDWAENQPFFSERARRSALAKHAADARWSPEHRDAARMRDASSEHPTGMRRHARTRQEREGEGEEEKNPAPASKAGRSEPTAADQSSFSDFALSEWNKAVKAHRGGRAQPEVSEDAEPRPWKSHRKISLDARNSLNRILQSGGSLDAAKHEFQAALFWAFTNTVWRWKVGGWRYPATLATLLRAEKWDDRVEEGRALIYQHDDPDCVVKNPDEAREFDDEKED